MTSPFKISRALRRYRQKFREDERESGKLLRQIEKLNRKRNEIEKRSQRTFRTQIVDRIAATVADAADCKYFVFRARLDMCYGIVLYRGNSSVTDFLLSWSVTQSVDEFLHGPVPIKHIDCQDDNVLLGLFHVADFFSHQKKLEVYLTNLKKLQLPILSVSSEPLTVPQAADANWFIHLLRDHQYA